MYSSIHSTLADTMIVLDGQNLCQAARTGTCGQPRGNIINSRAHLKLAIIKSIQVLTRKADRIWARTDRIINSIVNVCN